MSTSLATDLLALLLVVETGAVVAGGVLLWRWKTRPADIPASLPEPQAEPALVPVAALPAIPPAEMPAEALAPEPQSPAAPEPGPVPPAAPAETAPPSSGLVFDDAPDEEETIEDGRPVAVTPITLVWGQAGRPPERFGVRIDSVSRDSLVFGGEARRLDVIQIVPARRLFHTMALPQERLLAAHDADDVPIPDMRRWLAALPDAPA